VWGRAFTEWLRRGALALVNVKDFPFTPRKGAPREIAPVVAWHRATLLDVGFVEMREPIELAAPGLCFGANTNDPVPFEYILVMRKPLAS
jgi:hypothetical protein